MRTRIRGLLIALCFIFALSGCNVSGTVYVGSVVNSTSTSWSNKYIRFSGSDTKTFTVREGSSVDVSVSIKTDSGKLDLTITGEDGTSCYEGKELQTVDFTVTIDKPGDYTITVTADKHKGGFSFTWG